MGKDKRLKAKQKRSRTGFVANLTDGLTANFQKEIRNSDIWDQMVAEFGEKHAEELLRECKAEVKPEMAGDGSGDRTKDIS